jgi:predicted Fe-Mo cluster-binding NifX family protein
MKAGFAVWNNRIAPVFDVSRQIHIVEARRGKVMGETQAFLPTDPGPGKGQCLAELGVDTLVCGAISRPMQAMVGACGIRVIPFVAGDLREVIEAWLSGVIRSGAFAMPGCRRRGRGQGWRRNLNREERFMDGTKGGGGNPRAEQGKGGTEGRSGAGPGGRCVCPKCGRTEPHQRGVPCTQIQCPQCGANMTRQ